MPGFLSIQTNFQCNYIDHNMPRKSEKGQYSIKTNHVSYGSLGNTDSATKMQGIFITRVHETRCSLEGLNFVQIASKIGRQKLKGIGMSDE